MVDDLLHSEGFLCATKAVHAVVTNTHTQLLGYFTVQCMRRFVFNSDDTVHRILYYIIIIISSYCSLPTQSMYSIVAGKLSTKQDIVEPHIVPAQQTLSPLQVFFKIILN